jgi:hypothetical protein
LASRAIDVTTPQGCKIARAQNFPTNVHGVYQRNRRAWLSLTRWLATFYVDSFS